MRAAVVWTLLGAALILAVVATAQGDPIARARAMAGTGNDAGARAVLDSLLAQPEGLQPAERYRAELLRAGLEEDGDAYADRLRGLVNHEGAPPGGSLHLAMGRIAFVRGDLEEALESFQQAREAGQVEEGSLWEGLTAFALGNGPVAQEALSRAAESGNASIRHRAQLALGDSYRSAEAWNEAVRYYRRVREDKDRGPGWWMAATLREGECHLAMEEPDRAADRFEELIEDAPGSYEAATARMHLRGMGQEPEAPPAETPAPGTPAQPAVRQQFRLQVGAFGDPLNAAALAERATGAGFSPVEVVDGNDDLHRVLLGRFLSRERAEAFGDSVSVRLGVGFSIVTETAEP